MSQSCNTYETAAHSCFVCGTDAKFSFTKDGFHLFLCPRCGFMQVRPMPSEEDLKKLYSQSYFHNTEGGHGYTEYERDKEPMRAVFQLYLAKLEALVAGRKIFDVGAATGYFLNIAQSRGWQTAGSEISLYARNECIKKGHAVMEEDMTRGIVGSIDAVTMWDVLEHVTDPRKTIVMSHRVLVKDGVVAINTVDRSSVWARLLGKRWHLIVPPEHLNYFSVESLQLLLEQEGFEIIEIKKIGKSFSLPYIFSTLARWQKIALWQTLSDFTSKSVLRKVAVPINLRDNVFVIARKL